MSETEHTLNAHICENGHLTYPGHERCPECSKPQEETVNLFEETAEVVTWTTSTATPPGVRQPNYLAIVEFSIEGKSVRTLGQLTTAEDIDIGDKVRPIYAPQLRDPDAGIRYRDSQEWDGFRFQPL